MTYMEVEFSKLFGKNLQKLPAPAKKKFAKLYEAAVIATNINELPNLKKVQGKQNLFRFRLGDYRTTAEVKGNCLIFNNIAHRKDIYKDL